MQTTSSLTERDSNSCSTVDKAISSVVATPPNAKITASSRQSGKAPSKQTRIGKGLAFGVKKQNHPGILRRILSAKAHFVHPCDEVGCKAHLRILSEIEQSLFGRIN
jgi:hypothetical protein